MDFSRKDVLTFDCYGTLIDWETGILNALRPVIRAHGSTVADETLLQLFAELESAVEAGPYRPYRQVVATTMEMLGGPLGFKPTASEVEAFGNSVGDWPSFPDSPAALAALKRRYKLAIISNVDDELFAASNTRLGVDFDWIITAQQARSYKPSTNNFRVAIERIGVPEDRLLHVAQSLYHDHVPAKSIGLDTVWVNRRQGKNGFGATPPATAQPDLEVPDLRTLAAMAAPQPTS